MHRKMAPTRSSHRRHRCDRRHGDDGAALTWQGAFVHHQARYGRSNRFRQDSSRCQTHRKSSFSPAERTDCQAQPACSLLLRPSSTHPPCHDEIRPEADAGWPSLPSVPTVRRTGLRHGPTVARRRRIVNLVQSSARSDQTRIGRPCSWTEYETSFSSSRKRRYLRDAIYIALSPN